LPILKSLPSIYPNMKKLMTPAKTAEKTNQESELFKLAKKLVTERIPGFRKGTSDVPAYTHSISVADSLQKIGCR